MERIIKVLMPVMRLVIPDLRVLPSVAGKSQNTILTIKQMPNGVTKLL